MAEPHPCDLVHWSLLRAARRTASVGLVDPLLRSRKPDLPLHPAGLRFLHALASDIRLGKRPRDRLPKQWWPMAFLFPKHHGRIRRLRGQHGPLGVVLLLIRTVRCLQGDWAKLGQICIKAFWIDMPAATHRAIIPTVIGEQVNLLCPVFQKPFLERPACPSPRHVPASLVPFLRLFVELANRIKS